MKSHLALAAISAVILSLALAAAAAATPVTPQVNINNATACAVLDNGHVQCWGQNGEGQLGNGTNTESLTPVEVVGIANAVAVASNDAANCALLADRSVRCWGTNGNGQLGDGSGTDSNVPVVVAGLSDAVQISGSEGSFCARHADGGVSCWGSNSFQQFGTADKNARPTPFRIPGVTGAVKVSSGPYNTCVVISGGTVQCLGDNDSGQLGDPTVPASEDRGTPVNVVGVSGATDVVINAEYACAIIAAGAVKCWGSNYSGTLGNGDSSHTNQESAVDVVGLAGATRLSLAWNSVCALLTDATVKCWGNNIEGELGDGTATNSDVPVPVTGLTNVRGISEATEFNHCAWLPGGSVYCWGANGNHALGNAEDNFKALVPVAIPGLDVVTLAWPATAVSASQPLKTKLDKKKKTYTVSTRLTATPHPFVLPAEACGGLVTASVTRSYYVKKTVKGKGKKVKKKVKKYKTYKTARPLVTDGTTCTAPLSLKLAVKFFNGKKVKVTMSAAGSGSLQPASAQKTVKLPKVKTRKKASKRK